jgi:hypothetical protein
MSSFTDGAGHILFPHRLQPTANRGGLTFTEALIAPTPEAHLAPLPSDQFVCRLCTDHAQVAASMILDPIDGMTCAACHYPHPGFSVGPLPVPPNDNTGPDSNGCGTTLTNVPPACATTCHPSHVLPTGIADTITHRPTLFDDSQDFPDFSPEPVWLETDCPKQYVVRALSRSALRMLWHQRLGRINFCRLS